MNLQLEIIKEYKEPKNNYKMDSDDNVKSSKITNSLCGDEVELFIQINEDSIQSSFIGTGCSLCIASASRLTERINNRRLEDLHELKPNDDLLFNDYMNSSRFKCVNLAYEALGELLK